MVDVFQIVLTAGLALALAVAVVYAVALGCARVLGDAAPLPLNEIMRRRGVAPRDLQGEMLAREAAAACRRCALCASKDECRAWLASCQRNGHARFCPNAAFFEQVRSDRGPGGACVTAG